MSLRIISRQVQLVPREKPVSAARGTREGISFPLNVRFSD